MGGALHPGVDHAGASFELDRLELQDGLLVVSGSWFGLRGLRFVRPAIVVDGRRVLARIEDKPWPIGEDGRWTAAFPWHGSEDIDASRATLVVAPSVEVVLERDENGSPAGHAAGDRSPAGEIARLVRALDVARGELTDACAATELHEARSRELEHVVGRERRAADEAETARDDLVRAHAIAVQDRDRAVARCEEAVVDREAAMRAHRRMQEQRDEAIEQSESAAARREEALAQRDEARMARDEVLLAHRALQRQLRGEWAHADRSRPAGDGDGDTPQRAPAAADGDPVDAPSPAEPTSELDSSSPLGVRVIPTARTVAAHLHRAQRVREHGVTAFELWVMRILGTIAAVCFLTLLVMILKAFFAF
ncbi:MAG TPA: hypothetical protein VGF63_12030 [Solirubrobacteraceae bacterium]